MASYELIALDESTPKLLAPTASDTGTIVGALSVAKDITGAQDVLDPRGTMQSQIRPLAMAVSVAMTSATSGSNGIQVLDNANLDMGTNDFSWFGVRSYADYTPSSAIEVERKHDGTNGWILTILTTGILRLTINSTNYDSTVAPTLTNNTFAGIGFSVVRSSASAAGSVSFYVGGVLVGAAVAISIGAPTTVSNASVYYANGGSATRAAGHFSSGILYNRALTATEHLSLYKNGPSLGDIGANQESLYTSNFSAGVDSWAAVNGTAAGNIDAIGGLDDWLRLTVNTSNVAHALQRTFPTASSTRYRVTLTYFIPSTNSNLDGITFRDNNGTVLSSTTLNVLDTATTASVDITTGTTTTWGVYGMDGASAVWQDAGGNDVMYIKDFTVTLIGIVGWWDARDAQANNGQILDRSGNKNHAMIPSSGATVVGKSNADTREVRWTNTWAGTHELQYIGGVNQSILPAKAKIESIVGVVSGATIEDIIIGDGSDTDRYVALTTALAAGTVVFTLTATPYTDGTNLKLTVDPDANFTGSIAFTIKYTVLE